jgi:hypothetical protein
MGDRRKVMGDRRQVKGDRRKVMGEGTGRYLHLSPIAFILFYSHLRRLKIAISPRLTPTISSSANG